MLKAIGYKLGAPTVKEFLDRYLEEVSYFMPRNDRFYKVLLCLSKMACFSYDLMQLPTSVLAAGILNLALKMGQLSGIRFQTDEIVKILANFADIKVD